MPIRRISRHCADFPCDLRWIMKQILNGAGTSFRGTERGNMSNYLLISDAAKEVKVESHVLRYWEEELHLPIKRNELGHRYYTQEDVERFKQIKSMKERGLQLKAIKMILKDGKLDVLPQEDEATTQVHSVLSEATEAEKSKHMECEHGREYYVTDEQNREPHMAIDIVSGPAHREITTEESREERAKRLQWLLQQMIRETLRENNQELCRDIKESVVKELDYQFRNQEEREEEREQRLEQRNEEYYQKMDELLRKKSRGPLVSFSKENKKEKQTKKEGKGAVKGEVNKESKNKIMNIQTAEKKAKKKRHSIF